MKTHLIVEIPNKADLTFEGENLGYKLYPDNVLRVYNWELQEKETGNTIVGSTIFAKDAWRSARCFTMKDKRDLRRGKDTTSSTSSGE